jgi:hypothetical protein
MSAWLSKWAPASGVAAAILVAVAFFAGPNSPGDTASGAQVIAWYQVHHTSDAAFDFIAGLAVVFLVIFAASLARQVRTGDRWLAHGALGGAVFGGAGFLTAVGFDLVIAQDYSHLTVTSAQTLSLLENDFFLPIIAGFGLFGVLTGLAVIVGKVLPKWMGWVMFAFGIVSIAGPIAFFGILAVMLWVLVAGIWMVRQGPPARESERELAASAVTV